MPRPDHPLQDDTRLRFLAPRPEPAEGLTTVTADLSAFFVIVDRVGRNEALLLLVTKALRQRTGLMALKVNDLAWILRASNRRVVHWLDRLVHHRLVVYQIEDFWGVDTVIVEIVAADGRTSQFEPALRLELPTHWFVQVLPLVGRTTFSVYLYLLARERVGAMHVDHLIETLKLRGRVHARWHLSRLRRRAILTPEGDGTGKVRDPNPPTRAERLLLRYLALPFLRRTLWQVVAMLVVISLISALLLVLRTSPHISRP